MNFLQWFPGHMAKAEKMMRESASVCDGSICVLDARAPYACFNGRLVKILGEKPVVFLLNKADLANESETADWERLFKKNKRRAVISEAVSPKCAKAVISAVNEAFEDKRERDFKRGINRPVRVMVTGIPNTGKSTVINMLSGSKRAVTGDKAGVTRGKQWIRLGEIELLDTPGVMPPSFESQRLAMHLAYIGCLNDSLLDFPSLSLELIGELKKISPAAITQRYGTEIEEEMTNLEILESIAKKRGYLLKGGDYDYDRAAFALIDDFRKNRLGRITLESASEESFSEKLK